MNASFAVKNTSFTSAMLAIFIKENVIQPVRTSCLSISRTHLTKFTELTSGTATNGIRLSTEETLIFLDRSSNSFKNSD